MKTFGFSCQSTNTMIDSFFCKLLDFSASTSLPQKNVNRYSGQTSEADSLFPDVLLSDFSPFFLGFSMKQSPHEDEFYVPFSGSKEPLLECNAKPRGRIKDVVCLAAT